MGTMGDMDKSCTDIPQSDDPQVRAVFKAMNRDPGRFVPETECARQVEWFRAMVAAGVVKGGE